MRRTSAELEIAIVTDEASSFWLVNALESLKVRDPLDAWADICALKEWADARAREALEQPVTGRGVTRCG